MCYHHHGFNLRFSDRWQSLLTFKAHKMLRTCFELNFIFLDKVTEACRQYLTIRLVIIFIKNNKTVNVDSYCKGTTKSKWNINVSIHTCGCYIHLHTHFIWWCSIWVLWVFCHNSLIKKCKNMFLKIYNVINYVKMLRALKKRIHPNIPMLIKNDCRSDFLLGSITRKKCSIMRQILLNITKSMETQMLLQ